MIHVLNHTNIDMFRCGRVKKIMHSNKNQFVLRAPEIQAAVAMPSCIRACDCAYIEWLQNIPPRRCAASIQEFSDIQHAHASEGMAPENWCDVTILSIRMGHEELGAMLSRSVSMFTTSEHSTPPDRLPFTTISR